MNERGYRVTKLNICGIKTLEFPNHWQGAAMLTSLLLGTALVCAMPMCAPVSLGSGGIYFPCTGRVFGQAWEAYFDTHPERVMEGTLTLHYEGVVLVGYSIQTTLYEYPAPTTPAERAALFLNYNERVR